ncbi:MAG: hypothetical protein A2X77_01345 [Gammaproteobacteria bacterium GWE2_42_36]|nr:MAG: hypothetical protein A2X77_01345 [Gammaproteobacteria bacterium GWE2_42_36]HCU05457.1 hypothetical protein [Coxiellaceae bacterium]
MPSAEKEATKICPRCGIRKPLIAFLISSKDPSLKQYGAICRECKQHEKLIAWLKTHKTDDEDEGSGGKTKQHGINYYTKLLMLQTEQSIDNAAETEKKELKQTADILQKEIEEIFQQTGKEKSLQARQQAEAAKTKPSKFATRYPLSSEWHKIPTITGAHANWVELFRWLLNFPPAFLNPGMQFYKVMVQTLRYAHIVYLHTHLPNNPSINKAFFHPPAAQTGQSDANKTLSNPLNIQPNRKF